METLGFGSPQQTISTSAYQIGVGAASALVNTSPSVWSECLYAGGNYWQCNCTRTTYENVVFPSNPVDTAANQMCANSMSHRASAGRAATTRWLRATQVLIVNMIQQQLRTQYMSMLQDEWDTSFSWYHYQCLGTRMPRCVCVFLIFFQYFIWWKLLLMVPCSIRSQ